MCALFLATWLIGGLVGRSVGRSFEQPKTITYEIVKQNFNNNVQKKTTWPQAKQYIRRQPIGVLGKFSKIKFSSKMCLRLKI